MSQSDLKVKVKHQIKICTHTDTDKDTQEYTQENTFTDFTGRHYVVQKWGHRKTEGISTFKNLCIIYWKYAYGNVHMISI